MQQSSNITGRLYLLHLGPSKMCYRGIFPSLIANAGAVAGVVLVTWSGALDESDDDCHVILHGFGP